MIGSDPTIDYSKLGYNNRLQATDGLANRDHGFVTSTEYESNNDRDSVTNYNVRSMSADKVTAGTISTNVAYAGTINFNQISGGTATLGGTTNGDGELTVLGTSGTQVASINNLGIAVYGQNMSFPGVSGTQRAFIYNTAGTPNTLMIEYLDNKVEIETDGGEIRFYCDGTARISMNYGTGGILFTSNGGTTAHLDTNGNLKIKGTISQNYVF